MKVYAHSINNWLVECWMCWSNCHWKCVACTAFFFIWPISFVVTTNRC